MMASVAAIERDVLTDDLVVVCHPDHRVVASWV